MNTRILRKDRCENCGDEQFYPIRDKSEFSSVNGCLTDKDIHFIVANTTPQKYEYCGECETTALITTLCFEGLVTNRKEYIRNKP